MLQAEEKINCLVKMVPGTGNITVNGQDVDKYIPFKTLVMDLNNHWYLLKMKNI